MADYATAGALVSPEWAQQHLDRSRRPLHRGGRGHGRIRAEPHPGRRGLELDQPAVRRHPPRHRQPRRPRRRCCRAVGHRARTPTSCSTATTTTGSPPGRTGSSSCTAGSKVEHPQRRSQVLAGQRPARTIDVPTYDTTSVTLARAGPDRCARSGTTSCRASATRGWPSWTCARPRSSAARSSRRRA